MAEKVVQWESTQNGLENISLVEGPMPSPAEDEVLVKINTVSLNYRDTEGKSVRCCPDIPEPPLRRI